MESGQRVTSTLDGDTTGPVVRERSPEVLEG